MNRCLFFILSFFLFPVAIDAQEKNYDVSLIDASLQKDADAVVREHSLRVRIVSADEIYTTEKYAVTILNEKGYEHAIMREPYNKFFKVKNLKGRLYDGHGKEVKKMKASDVTDNAIYSYSFFDDGRYKAHNFRYGQFPFTVEYEIEKKITTLFFLPDLEVVDDYGVAVEEAILEIEHPANIEVRHKAYHIAEQPEIAAGANSTIKYRISKVRARKEDKCAPPQYYDFPTIVVSPGKFTLGDYSGDFTSWKSLGRFFNDLNVGKGQLAQNIKDTVHRLTIGCRTEEQKISVLYDHLKRHTRYVSVQMGIGGWQTYDANYVASNGYGDCKALTNYMQALLKEAGIPSNYVLVRAGGAIESELPVDFSHNIFNHVMLCIPLKNDTIWLECTADDLPAGYLSQFTADRDVLLIDQDGGKVVHTPIYGTAENRLCFKTNVSISEKSELTGAVQASYSGLMFDREFEYINDKAKDDIETHLNDKLDLVSYQIDEYDIQTENKGYIPVLTESMQVKGVANISLNGKRAFVFPAITKINCRVAEMAEGRNSPFYIDRSYEVVDTTVIQLPGKYTMEYTLTDTVNKEYMFGSYNCTVSLEGDDKLKMIRRYVQKKGIYPASEYKNYIALTTTAGKRSAMKDVVLLKKD